MGPRNITVGCSTSCAWRLRCHLSSQHPTVMFREGPHRCVMLCDEGHLSPSTSCVPKCADNEPLMPLSMYVVLQHLHTKTNIEELNRIPLNRRLPIGRLVGLWRYSCKSNSIEAYQMRHKIPNPRSGSHWHNLSIVMIPKHVRLIFANHVRLIRICIVVIISRIPIDVFHVASCIWYESPTCDLFCACVLPILYGNHVFLWDGIPLPKCGVTFKVCEATNKSHKNHELLVSSSILTPMPTCASQEKYAKLQTKSHKNHVLLWWGYMRGSGFVVHGVHVNSSILDEGFLVKSSSLQGWGSNDSFQLNFYYSRFGFSMVFW